MIVGEKSKREKTLRWLIFYDFLIIVRVVTSQSQYYTFISKAWMILQAQTKILMKQILPRILMIHFLFARAIATNQSIQNMKWTVWYTQRWEWNIGRRRKRFKSFRNHTQDMFADKYIYILQLINIYSTMIKTFIYKYIKNYEYKTKTFLVEISQLESLPHFFKVLVRHMTAKNLQLLL